MTSHIIDTFDEEYIDNSNDDLALLQTHEIIVNLIQHGTFAGAPEPVAEKIIVAHKKLLEYYRSLEK